MEEKNLVTVKTQELLQNTDYSYIGSAVDLGEFIDEMDVLVKELNEAAFTTTFDIQIGIRKGFEAVRQVCEDLIDRYEENSPNPEEDVFITKLYSCHDALEQLRDKCDYI